MGGCRMVEVEREAERLTLKAPVYVLSVIVLGICALGFLVWPSDGLVQLQDLTNVKIDSESPIKSVRTKKLGQNNFMINVKTQQGLNTGPMLPPKNKLGRWRDVKWWSDDFTKKYYPNHWSLIHKGEKTSSAAGTQATVGLTPAQKAAKRKLAARKAVILKIAKVNQQLMQGVQTLATHFGELGTRNITVDVASQQKKL